MYIISIIKFVLDSVVWPGAYPIAFKGIDENLLLSGPSNYVLGVRISKRSTVRVEHAALSPPYPSENRILTIDVRL